MNGKIERISSIDAFDLSIAGRLPYVKSYAEYLDINFRIDPWINFVQDMPPTGSAELRARTLKSKPCRTFIKQKLFCIFIV